MHLCSCCWTPPQFRAEFRFLATNAAAAPLAFCQPWCGDCTLTPPSLLNVLGLQAAGALHPQPLSLSSAPSCLPYTFQYAHFKMHQCVDLSGILVCCAEEPLLGSRCPTSCRFMGRYKGVVFAMMLISLPNTYILKPLVWAFKNV